jgi:hypothetical protein
LRTPAQIRADATATGTFTDYVGDGASVPYLELGLLDSRLGLSAWAYKAYLDARWPLAFKTHDWCYTPYGALINVSREEADQALYDDIVIDSPIDAWIVYRSVRIGGGPYFGVSQTGYGGDQGYRPATNMLEPQTNVIHEDP